MKLKKEIATLLLASTLLTASLTACQQTPDGGDKIDNTTPEITTENTTPQETTTPEPPSDDEINFEHPVVGENITCSLFTPSENIKGIEMRAGTGVYKFYPANDSKNRYFYIEQWDQVLRFTDGTTVTFVEDVLVTDDYLYVLAEFNASFLIDSNRWIKVVTMKIDRNGTVVESNVSKFEWDTSLPSTTRIYYNLYSPEQFYITHTDKGDADDPNGKWQIQVYESTDMGKSWSPKGAPIGGTDGRLDIGDFFLTREVGYFAYIRDELTHQYDVYTTTDGGGTWHLQPFSCIETNGDYSVKFNGIIVHNDEYIASFKAEKKLEGKGDEEEKVTFVCKSTDFMEWTLTATHPQSSPSPYEEELGNEYRVFRNFISDQVGYTFVFYDGTELLTLLKTTDGGKTWERQPIVDGTESGMHLGIDDAKMFTEDTGYFKKLWHGSGETYVTTDGGKTWERTNYGCLIDPAEHGYDEELSIEYVDGKYLLTVRARRDIGISFTYITQYESTDLKSWELVQPRTVIPCNGTHSDGIHYIIHEDGNLILYIPEWHQFFIIPKRDDMYIIEDVLDSCSAVLSETEGTLFFRDFSPDDKPISLIQFTRWNPEVTIRPLNLPEGNYSYGQKYCNFIDEKTGYLFLLGSSPIELSHFFKTTDGGETWVEQPVETSPSIYWKEDIICAKMLDEQVGCIFGSHHANDDLSSKTYVTADGGKTWHKVGSSIELGSIEAYDFAYENGEYIIFLRTARGLGAQKYPYYLVSTDLINWTFVEE